MPVQRLIREQAIDHGTMRTAAFPWVPIGSLAFISFASCFSVTYIFPIVPYLVFDLGMVDDYREPGLYAVRFQF